MLGVNWSSSHAQVGLVFSDEHYWPFHMEVPSRALNFLFYIRITLVLVLLGQTRIRSSCCNLFAGYIWDILRSICFREYCRPSRAIWWSDLWSGASLLWFKRFWRQFGEWEPRLSFESTSVSCRVAPSCVLNQLRGERSDVTLRSETKNLVLIFED